MNNLLKPGNHQKRIQDDDNKAANERHIYTAASSRGWKAYMRSIDHEKFVDPHKYLEISKYNYPKYLVQDKDFERFLILIAIN